MACKPRLSRPPPPSPCRLHRAIAVNCPRARWSRMARARPPSASAITAKRFNGPARHSWSSTRSPDNATTSRMSPDVRATSRRRNVSEGGLLGLWTSTGSFNGIFADRSSYVAAGMNQSAITATSSSTATPVTAADVPTSPVVATGSWPLRVLQLQIVCSSCAPGDDEHLQ